MECQVVLAWQCKQKSVSVKWVSFISLWSESWWWKLDTAMGNIWCEWAWEKRLVFLQRMGSRMMGVDFFPIASSYLWWERGNCTVSLPTSVVSCGCWSCYSWAITSGWCNQFIYNKSQSLEFLIGKICNPVSDLIAVGQEHCAYVHQIKYFVLTVRWKVLKHM